MGIHRCSLVLKEAMSHLCHPAQHRLPLHYFRQPPHLLSHPVFKALLLPPQTHKALQNKFRPLCHLWHHPLPSPVALFFQLRLPRFRPSPHRRIKAHHFRSAGLFTWIRAVSVRIRPRASRNRRRPELMLWTSCFRTSQSSRLRALGSRPSGFSRPDTALCLQAA